MSSSPSSAVPLSTNVLVIGGGPGGSYAAAALAREGFQVTLLERDHFPRYHIGESMLPSCQSFLRFIGAEDKVRNYGFTIKVGGAVKLNQYKREGYTDFVAENPNNYAWNVVRSEFDEILLRHAAENGASVYEGVRVASLEFSAEDNDKPVAADWVDDKGNTGKIQFDWLVDASGRNGIVSTRYLKNRKFNQSLKNMAMWSYWDSAEASVYGKGTSRENAPWFEALTDETGWAWFIPLHNGTVSVGVVMSEVSSRAKKAKLSEMGAAAMQEHYLTQLQLAPGLVGLLGKAQQVGDVKSAGDYSYSADKYAGGNYRIVGDAGAFIDPFFSSGVHLAFAGGLSAAATISACIRGQCTAEEAATFHTEKVGTSYTRFLLVVLGIYKQIRSQQAPVLSDINEDNFDRAFNFLRPIIQGIADTDSKLTADELDQTIEFCSHAVSPTTAEMHEKVVQRLDQTLTGADGPILAPRDVESAMGDDEEAKSVLMKINSRKAMRRIHDWEDNFQHESLGGFTVVLKQGSLGLERA
ncbi:putative halogenase [Roridomyces roridus]|uniref:Halogenase n=1 Tax=Roridomyces roridus TaxID=1738132 RepID=A0AAD7BYV4_9AGAR|nr:putative halogenase [Roridomyces roridus]